MPPSACLTGTAIQRVPSSLSSSSTAYPFCRTISSRSRIAVSSVRVCGVRCWRGIASRFASSLSARCAIRHWPSAVQKAGLICPVLERKRTICGLSKSCRKTIFSASRKASRTFSRVVSRNSLNRLRAPDQRSNCKRTIEPSVNKPMPRR